MSSGERAPVASGLLRFVPARAVATRLAAASALLFALTFLSHIPSRYVGPVATGFGFFLPSLVTLGVLGATAAAVLDGGLLGSLLVAAGPAFGFFLALGVFELSYPSPSVAWGLGTGLAATVLFGIVGFLVGTVARAGWRAVVGR